jgi:hypothetical protein
MGSFINALPPAGAPAIPHCASGYANQPRSGGGLVIGGSAVCRRARAACSTTKGCTGSIVKSNSRIVIGCYEMLKDGTGKGESLVKSMQWARTVHSE